MRKLLILLIKFSLGFGILYWLYQKGSLDFSLFSTFVSSRLLFISCLALFILKILLNSYRWQRVINSSLNKKIKFKETLNAEWSSLFLGTILPGSISGDIVRVGFLKRNKIETSFLVLTVLYDRFLGFFGLILLSLISSLLYSYYNSEMSLELKSVILINIYLFFFLTFLSTIMFFIKRQWLFKIIKESKFLMKFFITIFNFFSKKREFIFQVIMSTFSHVLSLLALWLITNLFLEVHVNFYDIFVIAPLGLLAQVLPLTPSGIGVGHAAFDYLYKLINIENGASIFNVFWMISLITNLLGFIPFLLRSKKTNPPELQ